MAKLALNPAPTFKATVHIPVAGGEPVPVVMSFKYRTRRALDEFLKKRDADAQLPDDDPAKPSEAQLVMDCVEGWEVDDAFTLSVVEHLLDTHHAAGFAILGTYLQTLQAGRKGN